MRKWSRCWRTALLGLVLASPARVLAAEPLLSLSLKSGRLSDALQEVSSRGRTGVLFTPQVVGERRSPAVMGVMTLDQALGRLLAGTDLAYRRTPTGAYVIFRASPPEAPVALPELLVVGRRSQNADIPRTENDIQPYQVFSARELRISQADDVDAFLRWRLTSNADLQSPSNDPATEYGTNRSEVNLHGLGARQTLVLVDGVRMPSIPNGSALEMRQPDINGVPLLAIERIETLTATAGGIHGPGATGGVVNLVIRRDYRGADLALTYGLSSRGDARRRRVDGRIGFTPDHGRTDIMFAFSRSDGRALAQGDRGYALRARDILIAKDPATFLDGVRTADAIVVRSLGGPLTLSPALGGASLGATFTYLPTGRTDGGGDLASTLIANAGKAPSALAPDDSGDDRSLIGDTEVTSLLLNVRRDLGRHVELFVDFLGYQNDGRANLGQLLPNSFSVLGPGPGSPFGQSVVVQYPTPAFDNPARSRLRTHRLSAGAIVRLPREWKADAMYTVGGVRSSQSTVGKTLDLYGFISGTSGVPKPPLDPFGDWTSFSSALGSYVIPLGVGFAADERLKDASLRLAGPLWTTRAGPVRLTLLAERRSEAVPTYSQTLTYPGLSSVRQSPGFTQVVRSLYGEVRAPIFEHADGPAPLRGLEVQLAVRHDAHRTRVPDGGLKSWLTATQGATAYTAGFKAFPTAGLMLRGSISTGVLPPTPAQLIPSASSSFGAFDAADPKRGGRQVGSEARYTLLSAGSLSIEPEKARTLSIGLVLNPDGRAGPRLSIDYTGIAKSNEIIQNFSGSTRYFIANEDRFPDRVVRAPLTDADRAAGFTGGVVTKIDASFLNVGRTWVDVVDLKANHGFWLGALGHVQAYGAATWQPRLTRRISPDRPAERYVGYGDGLVRWRGNIGLTLDRGSLSVNANGQYVGGYKAIAHPGTIAPSVIDPSALTGPGVDIPPQVYLDASVGYVFRRRGPLVDAMEARLGVRNLLDHRPPIATSTELGYSFYGDPRRRRFELSLRARF